MMSSKSQIEFEKEFSEKLTIHKNLNQEVVVTTVDKVRLCLMKNRDCLTAKNEWLTPLGIFLALLTTLVAAEFRNFIFDPNVWTSIYVIGTILSLFWLLRSGYNAYKNRNSGSIDFIVNEMKSQTVSDESVNILKDDH